MPISVRRIRELISRNRADVRAVDGYFRAKTAALWRWLYFYLDAELRGRYIALLRRLHPETRIDYLRRNAWRMERLGATRSAFYARSIVFETDLRREIEELELYLPRVTEPAELLRRAIELKERERSFLEDLIVSLRDVIPERPEWREEVERALRRTERRLEELRRMTGTLEGHVYDAETRKPIEGATVELVPLAGGRAFEASTDRGGYYRLDIPTGSYRALCGAGGYEGQEDTIAIEGAKTKDWYLKPVVVPKVWSYKLRVSARVVKGYAMGRSRRAAAFPPRWVNLTIEESEELARELQGLSEPERRKVIMRKLDELIDRKTKVQHVKKLEKIGLKKSPIYAELFFERFVSSLDWVELEDEYREKLIKIVLDNRDEIARILWYEKIEFSEWDFGVEAREPVEYKGEKASDKWEIYAYPPSGYAAFVRGGYYEHPV